MNGLIYRSDRQIGRGHRQRSFVRAFTLVELLVVIAIIGILAMMLLPAMHAAVRRRGGCRARTTCAKLGLLFADTRRLTRISRREERSPGRSSSRSTETAREVKTAVGLSWTYHILPFIEELQIHHLPSHTEMQSLLIPVYFCPSRRDPSTAIEVVRDGQEQLHALLDYAAANPGPFRQEGDHMVTETDVETIVLDFWQSQVNGAPRNKPYFGLITRTISSRPCTNRDVIDGLSRTMLASEKRLFEARYDTGDWMDDRGWTAGWSCDTIRSTGFTPQLDEVDRTGSGMMHPDVSEVPRDELQIGHQFGSAHIGWRQLRIRRWPRGPRGLRRRSRTLQSLGQSARRYDQRLALGTHAVHMHVMCRRTKRARPAGT